MTSEPLRIDAEEMLAQARWMRRLARRLVRDSSTAEDVVQQTWLAALESAPGSEGRLRPWLARVVRNLASEKRRGEAHRAAREEIAARPERSPSAAETAEKIEAQRVLVEALASIAEPYRTTVMLRYLEGLSAASIARKQGIPAATVRWRLQHGLEELRSRLDKRFGGERRSWALALLPLARRPPLSEIAQQVAAAAAQGAMVMNTSAKVAVTIGAVLAVGAGIWIAQRSPEAAPAGPSTTVTSSEALTLAAAPQSAPRESDKSLIVGNRETAEGVRRDAPAPAPNTTKAGIEARFVEADARPIPGVVLSLREGTSPTAKSDSNGRAHVDVGFNEPLVTQQVTVVAVCADHASLFKSVRIKKGETIWLGDLVLGPGGSVEGLVRGADGRPFASADVRVLGSVLDVDADVARRIGPKDDPCPSAKSGPDGTFRVDGVPTSSVRVWAGAEGMRWAFSSPIDLQPAEVRGGVELAMEPLSADEHIEGTVFAPDGSPADGAWINCSYQTARESGGSGVPSGADGRFVVRLRYKVPHELKVHDMRGRWPDVFGPAVPPGTLDAVLRFVEPRRIDLVVDDANGAPIEDFRVLSTVGYETRPADGSSEPPHADGKVGLRLPGASFRLKVRAPGYADAELGPFEPQSTPNPLNCSLEPLPKIHGRVMAAGAPVAGAKVILREIAKPNVRVLTDGFPSRLTLSTLAEATTNADGSFVLGARAGSDYALLCEADGYARAELSPIALEARKETNPLEVALTAGGAIEGRVVPRPGFEATGTIVAICRFDGHPLSQRVGPDGRFSFSRLTPGRWQVTQADRELEGRGNSESGVRVKSPTEFPWNCVVEDEQTTHFDLDLSKGRPCSLDIQLSVDGTPAAGWMASIRPRQALPEDTGVGGSLDGNGHVRLDSLDFGSCRLVIQRPAENGENGQLEAAIDLKVGENTWSQALRTGQLQGHLSPSPGEIRLSYFWGGSEELAYTARVEVGTDGRFVLSHALNGRGYVERMEKGADGVWKETSMTPVDVSPGKTTEVEIP
jgi:RNA polymerase sigma-70 factor (ECF subfamily)